jgi:hypothetical protein
MSGSVTKLRGAPAERSAGERAGRVLERTGRAIGRRADGATSCNAPAERSAGERAGRSRGAPAEQSVGDADGTPTRQLTRPSDRTGRQTRRTAWRSAPAERSDGERTARQRAAARRPSDRPESGRHARSAARSGRAIGRAGERGGRPVTPSAEQSAVGDTGPARPLQLMRGGASVVPGLCREPCREQAAPTDAR